MKRIEAIIQPYKLSKVVTAMHALPQFPGFTVFDAHGQGHGRGKGGTFAYDTKEGLLYHRRCVVVVMCEDEMASMIVDAIAVAAHTGQVGDGMITVVRVDTLLRIGQRESNS